MLRSGRTLLLALPLALAVALSSAPALAHDHDSSRSGHPLRIIAYVLHPVGLLIDTILFRPAHWVVNHEPFATVFGHDED